MLLVASKVDRFAKSFPWRLCMLKNVGTKLTNQTKCSDDVNALLPKFFNGMIYQSTPTDYEEQFKNQ